MPKPSPLPRKYASLVEEAQGNLRLIAQKAKVVLEHVETSPRLSPHMQTALREIETMAYRTALDLAEIEVAGGCDGCPSAPPMTRVQAHLLVLADMLERHAAEARQYASTPFADDAPVTLGNIGPEGQNRMAIRLEPNGKPDIIGR